VVEKRVGFIATCLAEMGVPEPRHRALVAYNEYVGIIHTLREAPDVLPKKPEFYDFVRVAVETVIPH
jgi:hypothetical protein